MPFFFVLNPALIGRGEFSEVAITFGAAVVGVILLAGALQGYLVGIGRLNVHGPLGWLCRGLLAAAGVIMMLPGGDLVGYEHATLNIIALCLAVPAIAIAWFGRSRQPAPSPGG